MVYIPYVALLAAVALIYLPYQVAAREMKKLAGGYDNHQPRSQQAQLEGLGRRAVAAHHNGFEAFAPFATGVLAAAQRGVRVDVVASISIGFIAVRAIYIYCYLADRPTIRSSMWGLGVLATGALLVLAAIG